MYCYCLQLMMDIFVYCLQLLMGVLQLGWLAVYLSEPLVSGFTTGAAVHVLTSQIRHVFGLSVTRFTGAFKLPKVSGVGSSLLDLRKS